MNSRPVGPARSPPTPCALPSPRPSVSPVSRFSMLRFSCPSSVQINSLPVTCWDGSGPLLVILFEGWVQEVPSGDGERGMNVCACVRARGGPGEGRGFSLLEDRMIHTVINSPDPPRPHPSAASITHSLQRGSAVTRLAPLLGLPGWLNEVHPAAAIVLRERGRSKTAAVPAAARRRPALPYRGRTPLEASCPHAPVRQGSPGAGLANFHGAFLSCS